MQGHHGLYSECEDSLNFIRILSGMGKGGERRPRREEKEGEGEGEEMGILDHCPAFQPDSTP